MTFVGAGAATTILDGGFPPPNADPEARGLDRLLEIHPTSGNVTLRDLTLREGFSPDDGAAIQAKLDELIRTSAAGNAFIGIEHLTEEELDEIRATCEQRARLAMAAEAADEASGRANRRAAEAAEAATE